MAKERTLNELRQVKDAVYEHPFSHQEQLSQCELDKKRMYTRKQVTDLIYTYIKENENMIRETDIQWVEKHIK
tara:strand:+ start:643 stop:861 length:219 start_codon:yes stop_codon:yes gene_type:complete